MKIGLTNSEIAAIKTCAATFPEISDVIVYGSRALGNHKVGSDVDITLKGSISLDTVSRVKYKLEEETNLPYFFDISDYNSLRNSDLIEHINKYGISLFEK